MTTVRTKRVPPIVTQSATYDPWAGAWGNSWGDVWLTTLAPGTSATGRVSGSASQAPVKRVPSLVTNSVPYDPWNGAWGNTWLAAWYAATSAGTSRTERVPIVVPGIGVTKRVGSSASASVSQRLSGAPSQSATKRVPASAGHAATKRVASLAPRTEYDPWNGAWGSSWGSAWNVTARALETKRVLIDPASDFLARVGPLTTNVAELILEGDESGFMLLEGDESGRIRLEGDEALSITVQNATSRVSSSITPRISKRVGAVA